MAKPIQLELSSRLSAPAEVVWSHVSTMRGVNEELAPLVRMTYPRRFGRLPDEGINPGAPLFRSWLLFLGIVPFDRHTLALESVEEGHGFVEESTSWLQRRWRHERTVTQAGGTCILVDHLVVEPRLRFARPLVDVAVGHLFRRRHRWLVRRFG
jgi:ligand-binding SRPBCC domain-containing protein